MSKTKLYIPIETKIREFHAKLFLSCVAAEAGYDVRLGNQKLLMKQLECMPRGIFLDKSATFEKIERYHHYRKLGFKIAAYDEEGIVPWNLDEYQVRRQFSDRVFDPLDYFFAWGQWQADFIAGKAPSHTHKILPIGHPRLDLTRRELRAFYDEDIQALHDRYGRFILFNTNFALCNHFYGEQGVIKAKKVQDEFLKDFYIRLGVHQQKLFDHFIDAILLFRKRFPEFAIVVRPHPSEDHERWRELLPEDEKITVIHEGNVLPWVLASEVMIHNSCTTGVEAYLLEQPVVSYRPVQDTSLENELANVLSDQEFTLEGISKKVEQYYHSAQVTQVAPDPEKQKIIARYVPDRDGSFSSERIVEMLNTMALDASSPGMMTHQGATKLKAFARKLLRPQTAQNEPKHDKRDVGTKYRSQKFPGIQLEEVQASLAKFQQLTGRFSTLRAVELHSENLFQIIDA